jgi:hypothetical protein
MEEYTHLSILKLSKYEITNKGIIRNIKTKKILKPYFRAYPSVCLINDDNERKYYSMHFLVASIFVENPDGYNEIHHKDNDRNNYNYLNLEWCTHKHNIQQKIYDNNHSFKEVVMVNKNNNEIKFNSYKEAYEYLKLKTSYRTFSTCISECCNGKQKTAYGYKWKYYSIFDEKQLTNNMWKEIMKNIFINKEGIVYNKITKNIIKGSDLEYKNIMINKKNYRLHRLLALAFIPNPNNLSVVNHINGNKFDNRIENLEWVSHSDNSLHSAKQKKKYEYISQYDINKNFVNRYLSAKDIITKNPTFNLKCIYNVLKNKQKTANTYIWKFESNVI